MADGKSGSVRFYKCSCFTTDNIFLADYKLHVRFVSEQQFRLDYEQVSVSDCHPVLLFITTHVIHY